MRSLTGIAASSGIAIAKAYRLVEPDLSFEKKNVEDAEKEIERFRAAIAKRHKNLSKSVSRRKLNWEQIRRLFLKHIYLY